MIVPLQHRSDLLLVAALSLFFQPLENGTGSQQCTVSVRPLAAIGNDTDALFSTPMGVARFRDRFIFSHTAVQSDVLVFASNGKFERNLGRAGSGPNEFRLALKIIPWGDSLAVYDAGNHRVVIFAAPAAMGGI